MTFGGVDVMTARYHDTGIESYRGNPLIEALPPVMSVKSVSQVLMGKVECRPEELVASGPTRGHAISRLIDDFFQPLSTHVQLEEKLSIMIRGGYVGRNPRNGSRQKHLQNGYERLITGDLNAFRFDEVKSTAQSMSIIGCSGSGKTTTIGRVLSGYPQVIYHPDYNLEQVVHLKVDCSHDGSLKGICQNFFRALDRVLNTTYEQRYGMKRLSVEHMLAVMAQIANSHALGLLIIDEIQHLSKSKSGGSEKMLNFFVTLVNTIGLPVVLVGTPRAKEIFEVDLRSARRSAGFGAIFWEPMRQYQPSGRPGEWHAFTNKLWKLQWLKNRDEVLTDEIRETWYDLTQGVLDIIVKLFVLAQLRAIATGVERITKGLLKQVYKDELRPVHPMLEALRSGDPERIAKYSDLALKDTDQRLIQLQEAINNEPTVAVEEDELITDDEKRLYRMLQQFGYESSLLLQTVKRAFKDHPRASLQELLPIVIAWLSAPVPDVAKSKPKRTSAKRVKESEWHTLPTEDLRFVSSQSKTAEDAYQALKTSGLVFSMDEWIDKAG